MQHRSTESSSREPGRSADRVHRRVWGLCLILGSLFATLFMAFHPSTHTHDPAAFFAEMAREADLSKTVHGAMMVCVACLFLGFVGLAIDVGVHRPPVRAGLLAYGIGSLALIAAATVNGFIVPDVVARAGTNLEESFDRLRAVLALCQVTNRALSHIGVVAICAAVALWSLGLVSGAMPRSWRMIGAAGLLCAALPLVLLAVGRLPMTVHGFGLFVLIHAAWCVACGVGMLVRADRPAGCSRE